MLKPKFLRISAHLCAAALLLLLLFGFSSCSSEGTGDGKRGGGRASGGQGGTSGGGPSDGGEDAGAVSELGVRGVVDLSGQGWKYLEGDDSAAAIADPTAWEAVRVPHTWNAMDGQDGAATCSYTGNFRRGPSWYQRSIELPTESEGRRVFLRFEGASIVADTYFNGELLGQHRGAFSAFAYEVTHLVRWDAPNDLRVRVDNTQFQDIAPLSGDWTMFGGLYRPVSMILTNEVAITPVDFASPGVYLTQSSVSAERAEVNVLTKVSNGSDASTSATVRVTVLDASGATTTTAEGTAEIAAAATEAVTVPVVVETPHLWNGVVDPYLYTARVEVSVDGEVTDLVEQPLGLRDIGMDQKQGFLLNGQTYPIRGVNRHQDRLNMGWAISNAERDEDIAMIREIGANGVRLAHYPQSGHIYERCDEEGLLVWAEIPLVNSVVNTEAFHENVKLQLREMIRQHYNHPSIVTWGLYNELGLKETEDPEALVTALQQLAKEEDPTRPTTCAAISNSDTIHEIPDSFAGNIYPGWYYGGQVNDHMKGWVYTARLEERPAGISEYGAGASIEQHVEGELTFEDRPQPANCNPFHPEEYQALVHEKNYEAIIGWGSELWGTFVWNMFDFASDGRREGDTPGRNDKGLVTYDRKTRKDAFFFYKANWNPEPMVYITGRRLQVRKLSPFTVKAYSNCGSLVLFLEGSKVAETTPNEIKVAEFANVQLTPGQNEVKAVGKCNGTSIEDIVTWTYEP